MSRGRRYGMVKVIKEKFVVIGKEGSTSDGDGFIQKLWDDADSHFSEIAHLAKRDAKGSIVGIWGAMSDISRSFKPWEDGFRKGLYLAGVECGDHAEAPDGWTKWTIPGYEYMVRRKIIRVKWHLWCSRCIINGWQRKRLNYLMLTEIMVPVNRQEILFM